MGFMNTYQYMLMTCALLLMIPSPFTDELMQKYGYKLKGVGPLSFHLGCDFFRDPDGTLCFGPIKYVQKIISAYESMFGEKPKLSSSPLEKNDHP